MITDKIGFLSPNNTHNQMGHSSDNMYIVQRDSDKGFHFRFSLRWEPIIFESNLILNYRAIFAPGSSSFWGSCDKLILNPRMQKLKPLSDSHWIITIHKGNPSLYFPISRYCFVSKFVALFALFPFQWGKSCWTSWIVPSRTDIGSRDRKGTRSCGNHWFRSSKWSRWRIRESRRCQLHPCLKQWKRGKKNVNLASLAS